VKDWNVVVSIYQEGFRRALRALEALGRVERSPYYNVLAMRVDDPAALLEAVERRTEESPALYDAIARVAPAQRSFEFQSAEEFDRARMAAAARRTVVSRALPSPRPQARPAVARRRAPSR
jgi:hypothetical protein